MRGLAAVVAGLVGGAVASAWQWAAWALFGVDWPARLARDIRLTAALLLGRQVLSPSAPLDIRLVLAATLVHGLLSAAYGLMLAWLVAAATLPRSLAVGALFGMALYALNLYGFTYCFPWFVAARDGITATAHVVFGSVTAASYWALVHRRKA